MKQTNNFTSQALEEYKKLCYFWFNDDLGKERYTKLKSFLQSKLEEAVREARKNLAKEIEKDLISIQSSEGNEKEDDNHNKALIRLCNKVLNLSHKESK